MANLRRLLLRLWALPGTLAGLVVGLCGLCTGGRMQLRRGVLEFSGGATAWFLRHLARGAAAMTLGHVILGRTEAELDRCRDHEHVHVRQYERWGPFFIPAYLACSLWLTLRGKRGYHDNPFEVEAYNPANHRHHEHTEPTAKS